MKILSIAIGAALLATAAAAPAQTASDAKCIVVANAFAKDQKDAAAQKLAQAAFYFYLGRISASTTPAQLKTMLEQQAKTLTEATAGPAMNECAKTFQSRLQMLQTISTPPGKPQPPQGR
jgi:hypothetical protein